MLIAKNLLTREASYKVFGTHRVMPSAAVSNARPETILSLRQRLAVLHQLERKLKRQSAVLDACRVEVISARIGRSLTFVNDAASRNPGDNSAVGVPSAACPANHAQTSFWFRQPFRDGHR